MNDLAWSIAWGILAAVLILLVIVLLFTLISGIVLLLLDKVQSRKWNTFVRKHIVDDDPYDDRHE